jgi:hypothetical protein
MEFKTTVKNGELHSLRWDWLVVKSADRRICDNTLALWNESQKQSRPGRKLKRKSRKGVKR